MDTQSKRKCTWVNRFFKNDPILAESQQALEVELKRMKERMFIPVNFEDVVVNFEVREGFTQVLSDLAKGVLFIRTHYNGDTVKCVHNKWEKGAYLKRHYHSNAEEYLYVTNGALRIQLFSPDGNIIETAIIRDTDIGQPYFIGKGVSHFIEAIEDNTNFICRFEEKANGQ